MKIDLFCFDGSPLGITPPDIWTRGVGGAELAMMTWAETMARRGHDIRIYNDPRQRGDYDGVAYLPKHEYNPGESRDVFIIFRSINPHIRNSKGLRIFWSCDQHTSGDYEHHIFPFVDRIVCISPYHVEYHKRVYQADPNKIGYLDLGVRLDDYMQDYKKVPGRCIFCSIPERGLDVLYTIWPQIKERMPGVSLVITSDYRLWGAPNAGNHEHRLKWLKQGKDVAFLGAIPREQLIKEQLKAEVMPYPCTYEELFCISAAEGQVAGALPVTTDAGALATTNQWGQIIDGSPLGAEWQRKFVDAVCATMDLAEPDRQARQAKAASRFDWEVICGRWERLIEIGEFS